ncbi:hypothetical protein [Chitinimonas lacunae]|uniref:Uncharacterized protein n=1 Tax=Chitinimonas lacunae TaxID=1963018 RepID=A0ABV8MN84_9NEIS
MTITATIDEPRNELEENFNIPICSEALYKQVILAVANHHNLSTFSGWGTFSEIDEGAFEIFNGQLSVMKEGIINLPGISDATKIHVLERLDTLQKAMAEMLGKRSDLVVLIG